MNARFCAGLALLLGLLVAAACSSPATDQRAATGGRQLLRVYERFKDNPNVRYLSHTIGPARDSVAVLRDYNRPLFNPAAASFLALQYSRPVAGPLSAFVRGEHRYSGAYFLNFDNAIRQAPFHVFNARAGLRHNAYELAVWGRNLTEVRYRTWATGVFLLNLPRLWGATATATF